MPQKPPERNLEADPTVAAATWVGFAMMCVGMFMAILDIQVVATSLPTIEGALGVAADQISWIQTAYLIAEVIAIPLTGLLTRALGMRGLFVTALGLFTAASIGCATSGDFANLIAWRVLQGFSGGALIPLVFSAVFLLFPFRLQGLATTIAGVLAVLAPTVGPIVGGWITETFSWHWLFLINVGPGIAAVLTALLLLPRGRPSWVAARSVDWLALALLAVSLASLEIGLKEAPDHGWTSRLCLGLFALSLAAMTTFVVRSLRRKPAVVELRTLADPTFAAGCALSFALGMGLFGSVYMMPVFLAQVHGYGALHIGEIMLITGLAQLATAPIATSLERRLDARLLSALGFALFAVGLAMSAAQTRQTGFHEMLWPQIVRGVAIMFCLLPPTRLALGQLTPEQVPDASGLFNLMRNLGGAIGLALIDTVIYGRAPTHAKAIVAKLQAHDLATAKAVGVPEQMFALAKGPVDAATAAMLQPMVEKLAFVRAMNEAWAMVAICAAAALLALPFARRAPRPKTD